MQNVPFSCKKFGGAKLYWNKCIQRCESTQQNPTQINLSIFKDNQQNFGKKIIKNEFIFLDLYFCFYLFLFEN
jgi:hypothetical protein